MSTRSFLHAIPLAPKDPILGMTETFQADTRTYKINLGVGVYSDENGKLPLLNCIRKAADQLNTAAAPRNYLPIDGLSSYDSAVQALVFGKTHQAIEQKRIVTVQTLGGTGGLRVGADFLARFNDSKEIWISTPSWENHRALFESVGFTVNEYAYYDSATRGIDFLGMCASLEKAAAGAIVVLHACCHNPTGADLTSAQWQEVISICKKRALVPFLDLAYQGFSDGVEEDAHAVRAFADSISPVLVANSFSKSFSLYGERIGALSVVCHDKDEALRTLSQLKRIIRTNYSNPPSCGAQLVSIVLNDPTLRAEWFDEVAAMRQRIKSMRHKLVDFLKDKGSFDHINQQRGMFSYSGLSALQMQTLRDQFAVYGLDSGRICIAALNHKNFDQVTQSIAQVL